MDPVTSQLFLLQSHCSLGLMNKSSDIKFVEVLGLKNVVQSVDYYD